MWFAYYPGVKDKHVIDLLSPFSSKNLSIERFSMVGSDSMARFFFQLRRNRETCRGRDGQPTSDKSWFCIATHEGLPYSRGFTAKETV